MQRDALDLLWKLLVIRGGIGIAFGIVAVLWPVETLKALVILWGFWALFDGIGFLVQAFQQAPTWLRLWSAVIGVLTLLVAALAIFRPGLTATGLTWALGIWLIVRGCIELVAAVRGTHDSPRWLVILGGLLSLLLGVLFVTNPGTSAEALALWLGIIAIIWGAVFVVAGLTMRRDLRYVESDAAPA